MAGGILLVNPNTLKPAVGPIGLDYLADLLRERGFATRLLDLCFETDALSALDRALAAQLDPVWV